jgi:oxygen-dependent protoporphyrinogen oxidase
MPASNSVKSLRVAVVGGGIAGLSAAVELLRRGHDPVVLESASRPGGKIASVREGPWLSEDGPNFLAEPLDALLDEAGLQRAVVAPLPPRTRWLWHEGKTRRSPSLGLLASLGAPRALFEPLLSRPPSAGESLREFLVRRLGPKAGELLSTLLASGVYAGDAARLSATAAFPSLSQGSLLLRRPKRRAIWSLREGLGSLPLALAARLGERLRLGVPVERLEPSPSGWSIGAEHFDGAIIAVPSSAAARMLPRLAEPLGQLRTAAVGVVHLGFSSRSVPRGFGLLDASSGLRFLGALLPSSMLPGRAPEGAALVTAICGGARNPWLATLPEGDLVAAVREDLGRAFGPLGEPLYVRVVRHPEGIPQYDVGHEDRLRAVRAALRELPRLQLAGAAYDGVSAPDAAHSGAMAAVRISR